MLKMKNYALLTLLTCGIFFIPCEMMPSSLPNISNSSYDYAEALKLSLLFYEAQRSGHLPKNNRILWRGDSALQDRGNEGEDLSGGYYDAGDFVKFGFTMAFSTTILAWGVISSKEAYIYAHQYKESLSALKWASDYLIKCHVSPNEFYGQVGSFEIDHKFWGRPEDMNNTRPAFKIDTAHPGSDLAGEAAAALAAVSIVFADEDPEYSEKCLKHAKELYHFAKNFKGLFHLSIRNALPYYESTEYGDELTWAGIWLYKATNSSEFLEEAESDYLKYRLRERPNEFFYNKKVIGVQVLFAQLVTNNHEYKSSVKAFCDFNINEQKKTPKGLVYIDKYGTLSHAANIALICLEAANTGISPEKYRHFARKQINYMLGDAGRSYVVGFGKNWPTQPTHAASSCPNKPNPCDWSSYTRNKPNPQTLYGALVSGPSENDYYKDDRQIHIYNEVTLDYNAGFQSAVAGLLQIDRTTI